MLCIDRGALSAGCCGTVGDTWVSLICYVIMGLAFNTPRREVDFFENDS